MNSDLREIVITTSKLQSKVRALGRRITRDYAGRDLHLVTVMKGGLFFLTDLARAIDLPLSLDCLGISSYAGQSQGTVRITKDLDDPIEGRHVLIVEDIIDTEQKVFFQGSALVKAVAIEIVDGAEDHFFKLLPFFIGEGVAGGGDHFR